jgi:hypothetical protein
MRVHGYKACLCQNLCSSGSLPAVKQQRWVRGRCVFSLHVLCALITLRFTTVYRMTANYSNPEKFAEANCFLCHIENYMRQIKICFITEI